MTQTDPDNSQIETKQCCQCCRVEELQVVGEQLLTKVKELLREGNVRRIIIKHEGHTIMEVPIVVGIVGILIAPVWAMIGVLGALLTKCSIEVVRTASPPETATENAENIQ